MEIHTKSWQLFFWLKTFLNKLLHRLTNQPNQRNQIYPDVNHISKLIHFPSPTSSASFIGAKHAASLPAWVKIGMFDPWTIYKHYRYMRVSWNILKWVPQIIQVIRPSLYIETYGDFGIPHDLGHLHIFLIFLVHSQSFMAQCGILLAWIHNSSISYQFDPICGSFLWIPSLGIIFAYSCHSPLLWQENKQGHQYSLILGSYYFPTNLYDEYLN